MIKVIRARPTRMVIPRRFWNITIVFEPEEIRELRRILEAFDEPVSTYEWTST